MCILGQISDANRKLAFQGQLTNIQIYFSAFQNVEAVGVFTIYLKFVTFSF